jgi:glycosyltransferase involved in cell wall biosynthesis
MRVMYVASAIEADGTSGGATHVNEVACGLSELGHHVVVVARRQRRHADPRMLECGVKMVGSRPRKEMALVAYPKIARTMDAFQPHVVIERFYNFAGAGVAAAHQRQIPVILEVNAPMVDPTGSIKSRLDTPLLGSMRKWAVRQATWSDAIVTPLNTTVPPEVPREKISELPWGANVERFEPRIRQERQDELSTLATRIGLVRRGPVAVFLGSFRAWHGASDFAEAARFLLARGTNLSFLAVGGGPELQSL